MKLQVIRKCKNCLFHYYSDLEDDICFQEGGCSQFSPIGLRKEDVEIVITDIPNKPKHSLEIHYD